MREWNRRTEEVRNLMNPAFCGRILYATIAEYQLKTQRNFPFPLVFLVLPLVLPRQIREKISSKTQFTNWIQDNQELVYNFAKRASDLVEITNESLEFMMQTGYLLITETGEIQKNITIRNLSKTQYTDSEIKECILKAEHVARWFAKTGNIETIYICLGVKP